MSYEPAYSPWGLIQTRKTLCPGFFDVSTASHGGIMVAREFVAGNLSPAAQRYGFWEGGYLCFEEDSDAQIVLRELMDRGLYTAPVNEYFGPGEYSKCIDDTIRVCHPDYWRKSKGVPATGISAPVGSESASMAVMASASMRSRCPMASPPPLRLK